MSSRNNNLPALEDEWATDDEDTGDWVKEDRRK